MAGRILGGNARIETIDGQTGLGTAPDLTTEQKEYISKQSQFWELHPSYEVVRRSPGSAATATMERVDAARFTVLISVVTTAEADNPLAEAKNLLDQASVRTFDDLAGDNSRWYQPGFARLTVAINMNFDSIGPGETFYGIFSFPNGVTQWVSGARMRFESLLTGR